MKQICWTVLLIALLGCEAISDANQRPSIDAVSYTHLDVYKRQVKRRAVQGSPMNLMRFSTALLNNGQYIKTAAW